MKSARVEQNLCIGCGLCCSVCDEVFRINEHGKAEAYLSFSDYTATT